MPWAGSMESAGQYLFSKLYTKVTACVFQCTVPILCQCNGQRKKTASNRKVHFFVANHNGVQCKSQLLSDWLVAGTCILWTTLTGSECRNQTRLWRSSCRTWMPMSWTSSARNNLSMDVMPPRSIHTSIGKLWWPNVVKASHVDLHVYKILIETCS